MTETPILLSVNQLTVEFRNNQRTVTAVKDLSFEIFAGEVLGVVGESGSGKSVMSRAIMGLVDPPGIVRSDGIFLRGKAINSLSERQLSKQVRGSRIGMVFQDPMTSLNPSLPTGEQIAEGLRLHKGMGRKAAYKRSVELLALCGISEPGRRAMQFPHEMSGGMRQRVLIAAAVACEPDLIIADEPTTALDVTVQLQVLKLLDTLTRQQGRALLLITHDLGVISAMADRVLVMRRGQMVEYGTVDQVLRAPQHPYTRALIHAASDLRTAPRGQLAELDGDQYCEMNQ
ncbi:MULTISPECIES: ABC transporter ATP-binding protein [unclassified Rhizobium]|uniref:ABC transporter ATP-binding protein n=1 Tax=unclassified Rhizobium TaxID=2613769 RepID=UPI00247A657A|nr:MULTISPECIES: ABC transporter ATP-binding protein [unclassified Rhizobium]MDH7804557.1 ABC-type dipeptide/oligopeptide/nickel transport system ATPase component [Rhizobium sp. AN70]